MSLVLIGYRGSGKTTVGRLIAARAGCKLIDTDQMIVAAADGRAIRDIFAEQGEEHFRQLESAALYSALATPAAVISTGGGIVMRQTNRDALRASGTPVVYLHAEAKVLVERIEADAHSNANRPNLTGLGGGIAEVEHLLAIRDPLYREVATHVLEVAGRSPEQIAEEVLRGCEGLGDHR
jgi:shikimate kinase